MSSSLDFIPTRAAALARLEEFLPDAGRYAADRNFVRPGHPNISRLSPWVQKRLLLEEEVVAAARERWPFEAVEKFVQEVYWRTYWKGWLEQRPEAWSRWVEAETLPLILPVISWCHSWWPTRRQQPRREPPPISQTASQIAAKLQPMAVRS